MVSRLGPRPQPASHEGIFTRMFSGHRASWRQLALSQVESAAQGPFQAALKPSGEPPTQTQQSEVCDECHVDGRIRREGAHGKGK